MTDKIKYLLNTGDTAKPIYEINYTKKTWRVVAFERRQYGDDFISGKLRKATDFTASHWKEVKKPAPHKGMRVVA